MSKNCGDNYKRCNIHVTGMPEGEGKKTEYNT